MEVVYETLEAGVVKRKKLSEGTLFFHDDKHYVTITLNIVHKQSTVVEGLYVLKSLINNAILTVEEVIKEESDGDNNKRKT